MKNFKNLIGTFMLFVTVLLSAGQSFACDRSGLTLTGITPVPGGNYALHLRFCVGAGRTGNQSGADNDTYTFAFFLSPNAQFLSQPAQIVSPQTGHVYEDTTAGGDTLVYFSRNYFYGIYEPWACISSTCGGVQTVCHDITLVTDHLPDSLWMGGAEGAGNIGGGCSGSDMTVYPSGGICNVEANATVVQPVCAGSLGSISLNPTGGTPPYSFQWSTGATTPSLVGLAPGAYGVTIHDATGLCMKKTSVTVNAAAAFSVGLGIDRTVYLGYAPLGCTNLAAAMSGGLPPFAYQWSNGATTSSINACPTVATTYAVTVTDARGCVSTDAAIVNVVDVRCGSNLNKVLVCHNGSLICMSQAQAAAHVSHGDKLGSCTGKTAEPETGIVTEALELKMTAFPTPATDGLHFRVASPESGVMSLEIFDLKGQRVAVKAGISAEAGSHHELDMDVSQWIAGMYLARLSHSASGTQTLKFTVVK